MAKKEIKTILKTKDNVIDLDRMAIISDNKISYNDDKVINTIIIKENEIILIRKNDEYQLTMLFSNNKSYAEYELLDINRKMNLDLKTIDLVIKDNYIYIKYEINDEKNEFEVVY